MFQLKFESKLNVSKEEIWTWITSPQGINSELGPWIQMSVPKNIGNATEFQITPGQPLYSSCLVVQKLFSHRHQVLRKKFA